LESEMRRVFFTVRMVFFTIWGFAMLLSKWFASELYQIFTPFLLIIPLGFLFFLTIGLGVWAIIFLIRRIRLEPFQAALPLIIFICVISVYLFTSFALPKVKIEHALYAENRETIVKAIQNGEYTDDGLGNITLPPDRRFLSCDGQVHVYQNDEQGIVVGFWSFRRMLNNASELVIYTSYTEPTASTLHCEELYEVEKLGENWYWVVKY